MRRITSPVGFPLAISQRSKCVVINYPLWTHNKAKLVLESRPRWLRKFVLGDKSKKQAERLTELMQAQPARERKEPKRNVVVLHGDFNEKVDEASVPATRRSGFFAQ
jgi:hypothetical protein